MSALPFRTAETSKFPTTCPAEEGFPLTSSRVHLLCEAMEVRGLVPQGQRQPEMLRRPRVTKLQIKVHKQAACANKTKMIFSNNQTIYSEIHKNVNNRTPPSGQSLAIRLEALLHFSIFFIDSQSGHGLDASSIQL